MNGQVQGFGSKVTITGAPADVNAALTAMRAAGLVPQGGAPQGIAVAATSTADAGAASCGGACTTNGNQSGGGALAAQSGCLTTGQTVRMCAPGTFPAYTAGAPLFVTDTPTRMNFDVPCAVAVTYFSDVAIRCRSANSIVSSITLGNSESGCCSTQVQAQTQGGTGAITISAPAGCDLYTPGILFTVGFSNNTSPGPVSISIQGTGSDGCPFEMNDIRVQLTVNGSGTLALLFGCDEKQRLYPVIARMRTDVVQIPEGTVLPGGAVPAPGIFYPNETLRIQVTGPVGMTLTVETLTWNHPTLSCLWNNALAPMGL